MSDQFEQKSPMNFEEVKPVTPEEKPPIEIWGGVTDPKKHNPKNFRYLVYAFNPFATASQPLAATSAELSGAYKVDKTEGDQSINLFEEPERLGERVSLSMSLIDQDHTGTWGQGGIIVEAPEENIVITSPTDTGSHSSSKDFLRKQSQGRPQLTADQLLKSTPPRTYNEVVAFAKSESGKTLRLVGFFIKVDRDGQPLDPVIAQKMREHAERLNLPFVEIQEPGPYEQEKFEIAENSIWANFRGNRYNLGNEDPEFAFIARDDKNKPFFPSLQEIEEVVAHFKERGDINEAQAQQILERYRIADTRRKSPKIEYDPKTSEIKRVTIKDGYGEDAIEYWLSPSGYCWRVNMKEYKKALREELLNPRRAEACDEYLRYQTPLSGYQVLTILESRKDTMEPEEYEKLISFFSGVRDKIDQVYNRKQSLRQRNRFYFFKIFTFF
jgi:hypothetical protein